MSGGPDYTLSYDQMAIHGFNYDVCMWCKNIQMEQTSKFTISQESSCDPSYENFELVPVVKRDLNEFPEDADKTENVFQYTVDYFAGEAYTVDEVEKSSLADYKSASDFFIIK